MAFRISPDAPTALPMSFDSLQDLLDFADAHHVEPLSFADIELSDDDA